MNKEIYEGYYQNCYEDSGLFKTKEMGGLYPDISLIDDILPSYLNGKKIRITVEVLEENQ